jgi:hypothetical protein
LRKSHIQEQNLRPILCNSVECRCAIFHSSYYVNHGFELSPEDSLLRFVERNVDLDTRTVPW